ncbi:MAG: tetratricopeptide repeat protein [Prevotellaceae bacterium]|nr:tetratricopeptide repeat protein [Prevotellaceae bacterium]
MNRCFLLLTALVSTVFRLDAQRLYSYPVNDESVREAVDLYSKEMYRSALAKLDFADAGENQLLEEEVKFVEAMSALYNEQNNAEILLSELTNSTPKNIHNAEAIFGYGRYLYSKGNYAEAVDAFKQIDQSGISENSNTELNFKLGYSYLKTGKTSEAATCFRQIKDRKNSYADAALYYYSHIEYEKGNYVTARQGFDQLKSNPNYSAVVPYYTLQIAFIQKDYDRVISEGESFISSSSESRHNEIVRLISEAYLKKGNINKAGEYLEKYEKNSAQMTREDIMLKAYIAYRGKNYAEAARSFSEAAGNARDSLAQLSSYYLGDCYLQVKSKNDALNAFLRASQLDFNPAVKEDAFYNYAKLALEVKNSDVPMTGYLEKYPEAINNAELAIYRAESLANKGKYTEALKILQAVSNPTVSEKAAMQRIAFAVGTEMFNRKDYNGAVKMFDFSLNNSGYNNSISALAGYWKANAAYMSGNYSSARILFQNFVNSAGSFNLQEYNIAHYNIGYCYFKEQNYDMALQWFRKYISFETNSRKTVYLGDCYNRIGDCYFKKRNYQLAVDNYNTAEALALSNPDYAALQKGISTGFLLGTDAKINALKHIPHMYPNSKVIPLAYYELGRTYQQQMKYDDAIASFKAVTSNYPNSPVYGKSLNALGLIEFNRGNSDKALSYYQQVVGKMPNSTDAQDALAGIKDIYIDQNRVDEYFSYSTRIGKGINSPREKDSLTFTVAEKLYQSGDCDKALPALIKYVNEYPGGYSSTAANFYIADCYIKTGNNSEAVKGFSFVITQADNEFIEAAWSGFARANYNLKNYNDAAIAFAQLKSITQVLSVKQDAEIGCMRSYMALGDSKKAAEAAEAVVGYAGTPEEVKREANLVIGREYQQSGRHEEAIKIFVNLAKNLQQPVDAEAKYRLIASYFATGKEKNAEDEILSFSDSQSRQQYWVAKSFIVLGDIYVNRKDKTQAEATFKSVIDNYPNKNDGIIDEAEQHLDKL